MVLLSPSAEAVDRQTPPWPILRFRSSPGILKRVFSPEAEKTPIARASCQPDATFVPLPVDAHRVRCRAMRRHLPCRALGLGVLLAVAWVARGDVVTQPTQRYGLGDLGPAALSPDQRTLATGGESAAYLWDFPSGVVRHRLETHGMRITALAFSPDGSRLVTGTRFGAIGIWSAETGTLLRMLTGHHGEINALNFSADGGRFVSASSDNVAAIWSTESGAPIQHMTVQGSFINTALFTPDGTGLITADTSRTNTVRLWDFQSGETRRVFGHHTGSVLSLALLPDGKLATGGEDRQVCVWNLATGERLATFTGAQGGVRHLVAVPGSPLLIAGSEDQRVIVWDTNTGNGLHTWMTEPLNSMSWIPGSDTILTSTTDLLIRTVDFRSGLTQRAIEGHTTSVTLAVAFSPDGQYVLSGGVEKSTRLWRRADGSQVRAFAGHPAGTHVAAFSPDGQHVLTTSGSPKWPTQLWRTETGVLEREFRGHTDWLLAAAFSPDGSRIATGAQDRTLRIWNTATGDLIHTLGHGAGYVHSVAFSPDGKLVAGGGSSTDPAVRIWNVETGQPHAIHIAEAGTVKGLAFSPSGTELVVAWEEGLIRAFNLATGQVRAEWAASGFINDIALSPDGERLLVGEGWPSFTARLLEWRSGRELRVFAGHTAPVESVNFNASGTQVLTGADIVRLWNIADIGVVLRAERKPSGLELSWKEGVLEGAASSLGPWSAVANATSPWSTPLTGPNRFFRVRTSAITETARE